VSNNPALSEFDVSDNYIVSKDDIIGLDNLEIYEDFVLGEQKDPADLPPSQSHIRDFAANKSASVVFAGIKNERINLILQSGNYVVELYNLQGRLISGVNISAINGLNATRIKIDNLSKGIFILNVKQSGVSVLRHKIAVK